MSKKMQSLQWKLKRNAVQTRTGTKRKKTQNNDQKEKPRTKRHLGEVKEISTAHPSFLISWPLKAPLTVVKNNWKYKVKQLFHLKIQRKVNSTNLKSNPENF